MWCIKQMYFYFINNLDILIITHLTLFINNYNKGNQFFFKLQQIVKNLNFFFLTSKK